MPPFIDNNSLLHLVVKLILRKIDVIMNFVSTD